MQVLLGELAKKRKRWISEIAVRVESAREK